MRIILHMRPLKFFLRRNWYGIRAGKAWDINGNSAYMLDIGAITIGIRTEK